MTSGVNPDEDLEEDRLGVLGILGVDGMDGAAAAAATDGGVSRSTSVMMCSGKLPFARVGGESAMLS